MIGRAGPDYVPRVVALLLVALSVGLDNFGACTALGVSGVDRELRARVALIFGVFEAAMPVVGILLGRAVARDLGSGAKPVGGAVLGLAGAYAIVTELVPRKGPSRLLEPGIGRLVLMGAALSIDNLVIGFGLGAYHVNLVVAAAGIAAVSVALSLLGLEIGARLGERLGGRSELVGGAVLILVGAAIGTGLF
jgi:putative Mn2+ efflux pump MntP